MAAAPPATAIRASNPEGARWMLASVAGATGMTVAVRLLTPDVHSAMLAFLRAGFAAVLVLPFLWKARRSGVALRFSAWKLHLLRGILIAAALNLGFYSIWKLPMATATILFFTAPVFATVLAGPILGEVAGPRRWAATLLGFVGAVVVLRPGLSGFEPAMLASLGSSVAFALTLLTGKLAARADGNDAVFVSSSAVVAVATLPPALVWWELPTELWRWGVVVLLVMTSALRQYADIRAYSAGEAAFLAPFSYLRLLTVGLAGYVFFGETIDAATGLGGTIIILSTLYIALREAQLRPPGRRAAGP
ncbi:MAG TPA: DMT family transporter [Thermohalobaculum sp.]|nr:DMT family transporter [Thermohalobaculum sp.]